MKIVKDDLKVIGIFFLIGVVSMCVTIPVVWLLLWLYPPIREYLFLIYVPIAVLILIFGMDRFILTDARLGHIRDRACGKGD